MKINAMYPLMAFIMAASIMACTGNESNSTGMSMSGTPPSNGFITGDYVLADSYHESYCRVHLDLNYNVTGTCKSIYDDDLASLITPSYHFLSGSMDSKGSWTVSGTGGLSGSGLFDTSGNATLDIKLPVDTWPFLYHQTGFSIAAQQNNPITNPNYLGQFFSNVSTDNFKSFTLNIDPTGWAWGAGFTQRGDTLGLNGYYSQEANSFLGLVDNSDGRRPEIMSGFFFGSAVFLSFTRFSSRATTSAGDQFPQSLAYPNPYQATAPVSGFYQGSAQGPSGSSPFLGMIDYKFNWVGFNKISFYGGSRGDLSYSVTNGTTYPYAWTAATYTIQRTNTFANPVASGSGSVTSFALGFTLNGQFQSVSSPSSTVTVSAVNMYGPIGTTLIVTPPLPTVVGVGATQQYKVELLYTDGTTADVTSQCTFTTVDPSVATIAAGGLATSVSRGFTQVIVNYSVYTGHAYIAVSSEGEPVLLDVRVMPPWPAIATGATQSFIAIAHFSDGSSQDVTTLAVWSSGSTTVATVDASTGVATGVSAGTANITATYSGMSDTRPLQVTDPAPIVGMSEPSYREGKPYPALALTRGTAPGCDSTCLPPRRQQTTPLPHPA